MNRLPFNALSFLALLCTGCDMITEATGGGSKSADGTYKGDFQVVVSYYDRSSGSTIIKTKSITGAVGFTISGNKVITTPVAGDGTTYWDPANKTMWVEFYSISSANESFCTKWRYYGGLLDSDQFLKGEGDISCVSPTQDYAGFSSTYWKVTRQ